MTEPADSQVHADVQFRARLFGPFRFERVDGGSPCPLGRKARAMLAYLLLAGPDPAPREKLAGLLWGDRSEQQARGSLRYALHELRPLTLGDAPLLRATRSDVRVDFDRVETDLDRLRALAGGVDAEALVALLGEQPGELLSDLGHVDESFDEWLAAERVRRQEERHAIATALAQRTLAAGSAESACSVVTCLLAAEPLDELATQIAMEARGRLADRDGVRRIFGRYADALRREVDTLPPAEMTALRDRLTASTSASGPAEGVGLPPSAAPAPPEAQSPQGPTLASPIRRNLAGAAALTIVLALAAGGSFWRMTVVHAQPPAVPGTGRVEVTAFETQRADPDLRRLSVSLADALARRLAASGVETAEPPNGARGASDTPAELTIAGFVDRDGDDYVVNSRILERRTGRVLWSGRISRPIAAAAAFPEQAANKAADVVNCGLRRRLTAHTAMQPAVFALVLNTCAAIRDDPSAMLESARRLVEAAPGLSVAHAMLGAAAARVAMATASPADATALQAAARASAHRALDLDPRDSEAYFALALSYGERTHWQEREQNFQRAIRLNPDLAPSRIFYIDLLREVGRLDEATDLATAAVAADPFSASELGKLIRLTAARGDGPRARALIEQLALIDPMSADEARWTVAFWWGDPAAARRTVRALAPAEDRACLDTYLSKLAYRGLAYVGLRGLPDACASVDPMWRVRMLGREGDLDGAYSEIAKAFASSPPWPIFLFYPEMKTFRQDRRFIPLARRLGLPGYWRQSRRWPDFCNEPDLPYGCDAVMRGI
jgi:DNA-binding SARP family transcriptional activator/tetratricopeptide (TPR) repeat protein